MILCNSASNMEMFEVKVYTVSHFCFYLCVYVAHCCLAFSIKSTVKQMIQIHCLGLCFREIIPILLSSSFVMDLMFLFLLQD